MAKNPGDRHSAANRDPVTIDLDGDDVKRLDEAETGTDGASAEAAEPTPMEPEDAPSGDHLAADDGASSTGEHVEVSAEETADPDPESTIADDTDGLSDTEPASDEDVIGEAHESGVADQTATFDEPSPTEADDGDAIEYDSAGENAPADNAPETDPETSETAAPAEYAEPKRSGMSAVGASLLGAVLVALGLGAAIWLGYVPMTSGQSESNSADTAALRQEVDTLRNEISDLQATGGVEGGVSSDELSALQDQVNQLRNSVSTGGAGEVTGLQALSDRITALENNVSQGDNGETQQALEAAGQQTRELSDRLSALETQLSSVAEDIQTASDQRQQSSQQTEQSLSEIRQRFDTVSKSLSAMQNSVGSLSESVTALASRLDQVQRVADGNRSQENVARAIAASALRSAVEGGRPYQNELQTATTLGASGEPVTTLSQYASDGVKTPAELAAAVPDVADAMREAAEPRTSSETSGGLFDQITSGARSLVTVRRRGDPSGEGPQSAITRFENAVEAGELEAALSQYQSLPPEVQRAGQSFADDLKASVEAQSSLPAVLSAIGKSGSGPQDATPASSGATESGSRASQGEDDAAPAADEQSTTPETEQ